MFTRFLSVLLLIVTIYFLLIFVNPELADRYGNPELNTKIRTLKEQSLSIASGQIKSSSLLDIGSMVDESKKLIEKSTETITNIQKTIDEKKENTRDALESVNTLVDQVDKTKNDLNSLISLSGSGDPKK